MATKTKQVVSTDVVPEPEAEVTETDNGAEGTEAVADVTALIDPDDDDVPAFDLIIVDKPVPEVEPTDVSLETQVGQLTSMIKGLMDVVGGLVKRESEPQKLRRGLKPEDHLKANEIASRRESVDYSSPDRGHFEVDNIVRFTEDSQKGRMTRGWLERLNQIGPDDQLPVGVVTGFMHNTVRGPKYRVLFGGGLGKDGVLESELELVSE